VWSPFDHHKMVVIIQGLDDLLRMEAVFLSIMADFANQE
jgi:hypothetical protein